MTIVDDLEEQHWYYYSAYFPVDSATSHSVNNTRYNNPTFNIYDLRILVT